MSTGHTAIQERHRSHAPEFLSPIVSASLTGAACLLGTEWNDISIPLQAPLLVRSRLVPSTPPPLSLSLSHSLSPSSAPCWHVMIVPCLILNHVQWWNGLETQPLTPEAVLLRQILQYVLESGQVCPNFPMQLCAKPCGVETNSCVCVLKVWCAVCGCIVASKVMQFPSQTKLICLCMSFGHATINTR